MQFKLWNISFSSLDAPQCVWWDVPPGSCPYFRPKHAISIIRFQTRCPVSQKFLETKFIAKNLSYIFKTSL